MQSLADLRASPHFSHPAECDYAFGRAVRVLGPKVVLDAVPLQVILSLFFSNITNANL
jgi:ribosomal RNA-processing protein 12